MPHGPVGVQNGPVPVGGPPPGNKPGGITPQGVPAGQGPHGVIPPTVCVVPNSIPVPGPGPVGVLPTAAVQSNISHGSPSGIDSRPVVSPIQPTPHQHPHVIHHSMVTPFASTHPELGVVKHNYYQVQHAYGTTGQAQGVVAPHLDGAWRDRKKLWKDMGQVVVSSVLSIHNRSKLFKRALYGYLWQTMPAESWEIILVDDLSTEDLSETYKPLIGRINLRHIKFDHTRHPLFREKNPGWQPGMKKNWFHTPALTINLGMHMARGPIISLCHPEVLHAPENFELAAIRILQEGAYLFGTTYLGTQQSNQWLDRNSSWVNFGWQGFLSRVAGSKLDRYGAEKYWYTSFLPRIAGRTVGGVDFAYLNGVAGEDDDFRDRVSRAGWQAIYSPELEGFHQDHSDEGEAHRNRSTPEWQGGLKRNRELYNQRRVSDNYPSPANTNYDWTAKECFVEEVAFKVGSRQPEIISKVS